MSLENEFAQIMTELDKFQSVIGRVHAGLENPKESAILGDILARMQQARVEAGTVVPDALKKIRDVTMQVQQQAQEQQKQLKKLQAEILERKKNPPAKQAPPPPKPEAPLDPQLGAKLSAELLAAVSPALPSARENAGQVIKEVWEDWNWESFGNN